MADEPKKTEPGFFQKIADKIWGEAAVDAFSKGHLIESRRLAKQKEAKDIGRVMDSVSGAGTSQKITDSINAWAKRKLEKTSPESVQLIEHKPAKDWTISEAVSVDMKLGKAILSDSISKLEAGLGMGGIDVKEHPAQSTPGTTEPSGKSRF